MKTLKEKITFFLTALAWLLFHVSTNPGVVDPASNAVTIMSGAGAGDIAAGTFMQILTLAPYTLGISYILIILLRQASGGKWPPWDRMLRIYFTVGMFFAFFFSLYQHGERAEIRKEQTEEKSTVSRILPCENRTERWYSA